jgi:glycosyltransferase involved in cell wall biosynthesis
MTKKIVCLPVAGNENPYQHLMMDALKSEGNEVIHGRTVKLFAITRTLRAHKKVDFIHFDWIHRYYITKYTNIIWLYGIFFFLDIVFAKLFFSKTQWIWTIHNIYPHIRGKKKYDQIVRSFFAARCKSVRVFSEITKEKVIREFLLKTPVNVIPEGSYVTYYKKIQHEGIQLKKEAEKFTFLYLGQIRKYKGLPELISAFQELENHENIRLIIAGKVLEQELHLFEKKCEGIQNIKFINEFIREEEIEAYYNLADIVVLPFRNVENSGSAILAMGFKKAILAPKIGVLEVRLKNQKDLLYNNLLTGLKKSLNYSKEELKVLGEKNYKALEDYQWVDFNKVFEN